MSTQGDLYLQQGIITRLKQNPVSRFAYTQEAFDNDLIDGVDNFDASAEQNIPIADLTTYNRTIIEKGVRTQGASIPRQAWNHFIGRLSYNLNKLVQKTSELFITLRTAFAHNANEYDPSAQYKTNDICYVTEKIGDAEVYTWFKRISISPETITNISPDVTLHWKPMQDKTFYTGGEGYLGLWTLGIEYDGILYMYYNSGTELPLLYIDFDINSKTYGQLIWELETQF